MNKLIFVVFLVLLQEQKTFATIADSLSDTGRYSNLRELIEQLITRIKNEVPDELNLPDREIVLVDNDYVLATTEIVDTTITGVTKFDVDVQYTGIVIPVPSTFTLFYPSTIYDFTYLFRAEHLNSSTVRIENRGKWRIDISNLYIYGRDISTSLVPPSVTVNAVGFTIEDAVFTVEGFMGNELLSRLISSFLNRNVARIINKYEEHLSSFFATIINNAIARFLRVPTVAINPYDSDVDNKFGELMQTALNDIFSELAEEIDYILNQ